MIASSQPSSPQNESMSWFAKATVVGCFYRGPNQKWVDPSHAHMWINVLATGWATSPDTIRFMADVNGDGIDDLVGFCSDGVYVAFG
mmetsp:Transcript_27890/g.64821  ORF Transcript_27890/g.64821 Transcript_27890/m.64821 type:complete len:87 (-) Transcript_27890:757-1017(-)